MGERRWREYSHAVPSPSGSARPKARAPANPSRKQNFTLVVFDSGEIICQALTWPGCGVITHTCCTRAPDSPRARGLGSISCAGDAALATLLSRLSLYCAPVVAGSAPVIHNVNAQ